VRKRNAPDSVGVVTYRNRKGVAFYLHQGTTKTGNPRYFMARNVGDGALSQVPSGFEICESINGVVSVRRAGKAVSSVPDEDVAIVARVLASRRHLDSYKVQAVSGAIVIFEPYPRPADLQGFAQMIGMESWSARAIAERIAYARYDPVMKFERDGNHYSVFRMTYRGHGGWSYPLSSGPLLALARKFLPAVGTEDFFDLT